MNTKQMEAALSKINPTTTAAEGTPQSQPFHMAVAGTLGAIPSNAVGFFAAIGTSYKYHEAVRKGLL